MILLAEFLVSIVRILLLICGIIFIYIFGENFYRTINNTLFAFNAPCIELISLLITVIPIAFLLYGTHARRYFWQREAYYNMVIIAVCFVLGAILVFSPISFIAFLGPLDIMCDTGTTIYSQFGQIVSTGLIASVLAFIGFDIGVLLKDVSLKVTLNYPKATKKKKK